MSESKNGSGRRWERVAAVALGVVVVLGLLEVALRVASAVYWRDEGRPGSETGLVIPDAVRTCRACPKILVVGDSYTYGVGAWRGHDYPSQLERMLNTPPREPPVVVVNGGLGGANSTFVRERLESFLDEFTPDLVLILAGGTNAINFGRYYAFANADSFSAALDRWTYPIRTIRFFRYALADLMFENRPSRKDPYMEIPLEKSVEPGARWLESRRATDQPLGPDVQAGLDQLRKGDLVGAASTFRKCLEARPGHPTCAWGLGTARRHQGRYAEAYRIQEEALRLAPRDPLLWCGAGMCRMYQGLNDPGSPVWYEDAQRLFRNGIEVAPGYSGNHCGLGTVLELSNEREAAVATLKQGIEVNPDDPRCYPSLMAIAELLGKHRQLVSFLEQFSNRSVLAANAAAILSRECKAASAWMRYDLNAMVDLCKRRGIPVILQDYPHDTGANEVLRSVAHDQGVPIVRHREVFEAMLRSGTPLFDLFIPDMHCNDRGYEVMAENIYRKLQELNMFPHPMGGCDRPGGEWNRGSSEEAGEGDGRGG